LVPDISALPKVYPWNKQFAYIPLIERYSTTRDSLINISIKRVADIVFASLALALFLPIGLIIHLAIKIEDGGPTFYKAKRVGKNKRIISFFKFRSMVMNAEKLKKDLLQYNARKDGILFKMENDPRITRVGKILRKFSLDEVPQFINVLKGDMSLVGPRPPLSHEYENYTDWHRKRLHGIPGITGLWQVSGKSKIPFEEMVRLDLHYLKNWSLWLDIKIILRTIPVMFKGEGY
jgi:exopolysaccharide biosynthesis polyprenyl glycosylphosphotransferase